MDERVKFIARFLEGEKVAALAREFGISRKTAYKIIERYQDTGLEGLTDLCGPCLQLAPAVQLRLSRPC